MWWNLDIGLVGLNKAEVFSGSYEKGLYYFIMWWEKKAGKATHVGQVNGHIKIQKVKVGK